jgi:hypothetical protein
MKRILFSFVMVLAFAVAGWGQSSLTPSYAASGNAVLQNASYNEHPHHRHHHHHHHHHHVR